MCLGKTKFVKPNLNITSKEFIIFQEFKRNRIYFGTPIETPRNFSFVVTKDEKVFDVLDKKFSISIKELPETTQYMKLYKLEKGKEKKFFEAETYFVNQNSFDHFPFETPLIMLEDKEFGIYGIKSSGEISLRVTNPKGFVSYLLPKMGIISSVQTRKILDNFVNEKIAQILEKENPSARNLYFKNIDLLKVIFEKLTLFLEEIGIELLGINLVSTKFPNKIETALSSIDGNKAGNGICATSNFEQWQNSNPANQQENASKPKFVTITPTGNKNGPPFFKESMAPYFFENSEEPKEEKTVTPKKQKKSIWKNVDQIADEEKSKKIVDLNSED